MQGKLIDDLTTYRLRMIGQRRGSQIVVQREVLRGLYDGAGKVLPLRSLAIAAQERYESQVNILMEARLNKERARL